MGRVLTKPAHYLVLMGDDDVPEIIGAGATLLLELDTDETSGLLLEFDSDGTSFLLTEG